MDRNTLGIYVQVPFCQTKCTYCNFHTGVVARSLYRPYVDAVCREIRESRALRGVTADTVYLGGGTPSLLEPADLRRIMEFQREAGFKNVSMDLIAGLPHQTRATWGSSVDELVAMRPEHVSIYLLEVDEGSRLGRELLAGGKKYGAGRVPSDDEMADFYESACVNLEAKGFEHYEISNWGLPGRASKHNLKYWRREPYVGFGVGAHSFDGQKRWANVHDPAAFAGAIEQGRSAREGEEVVTPSQALEEELFLGLRELAGIDLARIERQYGADLTPRVGKLLEEGLIEREGDTIRLTPEKLTISNEAFVELLG